MTIKELTKGLKVNFFTNSGKEEINGIAYDSRKVQENDLFVAIKGFKDDGHKYIQNAVHRGASYVVAEKFSDIQLKNIRANYLCVENSRHALAHFAKIFYQKPSHEIAVVGITGTNGKTSTCYILKSILEAAGHASGLVGTIDTITGNRRITSTHTTPESLDLQCYFREMVNSGMKYAVVEISSHALTLKRVEGCAFQVAAFTNFTRDHLDFHDSMEDYFNAKKRIFNYLGKNGLAVLNWDDPYLKELSGKLSCPVITCGTTDGASMKAGEIKNHKKGLEFQIQVSKDRIPIQSNLIGFNNIQNILISTGIAYALGIEKEAIIKGIQKASFVSGRFEKIHIHREVLAIVDYAHTDDALKRLLMEAKTITDGSVIVIFGCGGNRDKGKRPLMGQVAEKLGDFVIVTSDNPRDENPMDIINDIILGMKRTNYLIIPDREEAIKRGVSMAKPSDTIVIAGKGHEDYQEIKGRRYPFKDREVLAGHCVCEHS